MSDDKIHYQGDEGDELTELHELDHDEPRREGASFSTDHAAAVPVYERAATGHTTHAKILGATPEMLFGVRAGRKYAVLSCPNTYTPVGGAAYTPKGFMVAEGREILDTGLGYQVNPGDSVEIDSEDTIWVAPLPGNTTGLVQYVETFNPRGGPVH